MKNNTINWHNIYQDCLNGITTPLKIIQDYQEEEKVLHELSLISKIPIIDLKKEKIDISLARSFSLYNIKHFLTFPFKIHKDIIHMVSLNPFNPIMIQSAKNIFNNKKIQFYFIKQEVFEIFFARLENDEYIFQLSEEVFKDIEQKNPNITLTDSKLHIFIRALLKEAIKLQASDIHIETYQNHCLIRYRIHGELTDYFFFEHKIFPMLSSHLKLLAHLDISEKRKAQDGRFSMPIHSETNREIVDFRLSTLPVLGGESLVLRVLDKKALDISLHNLGFAPQQIHILKHNIQKNHGILFITGPTGSGKTTTLYALIKTLEREKIKIITIEDPIEYEIQGISQVLINEKINFSCSEVLKHILRQDPDIIMVGEIRDTKTLQLAFQASLTGHLVLSTLHTSDSLSSVVRLLDMGIEPYFLSSTLLLVVSQHLAKRLCPHCSFTYNIVENNPKILTLLGQTKFYDSKGCIHCHYRGFFGRELLSEFFIISPRIQEAIHKKASKQELINIAKEEGFESLLEQGLAKAKEGKIALKEIYNFFHIQ